MILINSVGEMVVSPIIESVQIRVYVKDPKEAQPGELENQNFYELRLAPEELFKGKGGLRASNRELPASRLTFAKMNLFSTRGGCNDCHGGAGVKSLNTYTHAFGTLPNSPWFEPSSESWQNTNTLNWKKRDYTWGFLSALLDSR
jgi:hypothetical protein